MTTLPSKREEKLKELSKEMQDINEHLNEINLPITRNGGISFDRRVVS